MEDIDFGCEALVEMGAGGIGCEVAGADGVGSRAFFLAILESYCGFKGGRVCVIEALRLAQL